MRRWLVKLAGTAGALLLAIVPLAGAEPPGVSITTSPGDPTTSTQAQFEFTSPDPGATFDCQVDGGGFSACTTPSTHVFTAHEGSNTFDVRATNATAPPNTSIASFTWTVDTTPPVLTLPANPSIDAPSYTGPVAVTYTATASDGSGSGIASFGCAPASGSLFPLGATNVSCTATDNVGKTASGSFTVTVKDTVAPSPPNITGGPTGPTNNAVPTFGFEAVVDASSYQCSIDDATPATPCNLTFTPAATLGDGPHTFYVTSSDLATNRSTPRTRSFNVDTTRPVLSLANKTFDAPGYTGPVAVPYTATASDGSGSGIATFGCTPASGTLFPLGVTTVSCTATDNASNTASGTLTVTVTDTTPPDTAITGSIPAAIKATTLSISFSSPDPSATFECQVDVGAFAACTSPLDLTGLTDGQHTFAVRARDVAGNRDATPATAGWTVDATPPVLSGPGNRVVEADGPDGTRVGFAVSASDGTPPAPLLPGAIVCNPPSPAQFALGRSTVTCTATDSVGNVGTLAFNVTVVDTAPPSINAPDVSFTATGTGGIASTAPAVQSYLIGISASDLVSTPTLSVSPPAVFPLGTTTLVVTARDAAGNTASKNVTVTVLQPGTAAPPPDLTPPGRVTAARAKAGDRRVTLTWRRPRKDVARVEVRQSLVGEAGTSRLVYNGLAETFTSKGLRNGATYRFVLVVFDAAGNSSAGVVVTASPQALPLVQPPRGARLSAPPILRWAPVPSSYFNVQLYFGGSKVLSAWPAQARLQLSGKWKYKNRTYLLKPGVYTWYVWPGLGARADARYGALLGKSSFVVSAPKR